MTSYHWTINIILSFWKKSLIWGGNHFDFFGPNMGGGKFVVFNGGRKHLNLLQRGPKWGSGFFGQLISPPPLWKLPLEFLFYFNWMYLRISQHNQYKAEWFLQNLNFLLLIFMINSLVFSWTYIQLDSPVQSVILKWNQINIQTWSNICKQSKVEDSDDCQNQMWEKFPFFLGNTTTPHIAVRL